MKLRYISLWIVFLNVKEEDVVIILIESWNRRIYGSIIIHV